MMNWKGLVTGGGEGEKVNFFWQKIIEYSNNFCQKFWPLKPAWRKGISALIQLAIYINFLFCKSKLKIVF